MENFVFLYIGVSIFTYRQHTKWDPVFISSAFVSFLLNVLTLIIEAAGHASFHKLIKTKFVTFVNVCTIVNTGKYWIYIFNKIYVVKIV